MAASLSRAAEAAADNRPMELRHEALTAAADRRSGDEGGGGACAVRACCAAGGRRGVAAEPAGLPGRPERPRLVAPKDVPTRSPFTLEGRAALLHSIAHIEFNAINLALDAVWRFAGLPEAYYRDWLRVAAEESLHFTLLREHLHSLGHDYGDFDAHDGLWTMTARTAHDIVARMALVPRTLEARGLDATPPLQAKLAKAGDARAVEILDVILRDEIGHVAIGNRWYRFCASAPGSTRWRTTRSWSSATRRPRLRPPFNDAARRAAGFTDDEIAYLTRAD